MTTPSGAEPPGNFPSYGSWDSIKDKNQADWEAEQTDVWNDAAGGVLAGFGSMIQDLPMQVVVFMLHMLADLLDMVPIVGDTLEAIVEGIADGINETYSTANTAQSTATTAQSTANTANTNASNAQTTANTANTNATNAQSTANTANTNATNAVRSSVITKTEVLGDLTRYTFGSSGSWTKPTPPAGKVITKIGLIAINGGNGGGRDTTGGLGPEGGLGGGYQYREFTDAEIPSSLTVTVGIGGAGRTSGTGAGTVGGVTSITNGATTYIQGIAGTSNIRTAQGPVASSGAPGDGGIGGGGADTDAGGPTRGSRGGGSALAVGGNGGANNGSDGQAGGTPSSDPQIVSGGGGGGGGGGDTGLGSSGGNGGVGGAPGGGGGAGGIGVGSNADGNGGSGANGAAYILVWMADA